MKPIICKTTGEAVNTYQQYLHTEHWKTVKKDLIDKRSSQHKCRCCGIPLQRKNSPRYETHHRTYKNIGSEKLKDLVALCVPCHRLIHEQVRLDIYPTVNIALQRLKKLFSKSKTARKNQQRKSQNV
jgi:hypothetical protein